MSQGGIKQYPLWSREIRRYRKWNEQKLPKVLPGYSGGKLPGRSTKEGGREEEKAEEECKEGQVRNEIVPKVIADIEKTKARAPVDGKPIAQRTVG